MATWHVPEAGFLWDERPDGPYLIPGEIGQRAAAREYDPLTDTPALFERFSRLRGAEDVLGFANQRGDLGLRPTPAPGVLEWPAGESLDEWLAEAREMRLAVELWKAILASDGHIEIGRLLEVSQFPGGRPATALHVWVKAIFGDLRWTVAEGDPRELTALRPGGPRKDLAAFVVQRLVDARIGQVGLGLVVRFRDKLSDPELDYAPTTLRAALWLQFALAVVEMKAPKFCLECSGLILDPQRSTRSFHDDLCRVRYNNRKRGIAARAAKAAAAKAAAAKGGRATAREGHRSSGGIVPDDGRTTGPQPPARRYRRPPARPRPSTTA